MRNLYESNPSFKNYVDDECKQRKCDIETAFTFSWVKNAYEYYLDVEKKNASMTVLNAGCGGAGAEMGECK